MLRFLQTSADFPARKAVHRRQSLRAGRTGPKLLRVLLANHSANQSAFWRAGAGGALPCNGMRL